MKGLPTSTWILLFFCTVPWLLLTFWYVQKVKRVERERSESSNEQ